MRLILDDARTLDEALQLVERYNLHFVQHPEHLMIGDASGRSCIVEWVDGQVRVTPCEGSWQVCTNYVVWEKTEEQKDAACERYKAGSAAADEAVGATSKHDAAPELKLDDVQRVVQRMSVPGWTMWTSVYDLKRRELRVLYKSPEQSRYNDRLGD